jgi:hypothetical protein
MGAENKFTTNKHKIMDGYDRIKKIQLGVVSSIDDDYSMGRIKVFIPGQPEVGGDDGTPRENLPWCYPMIQKFFSSTPKVGEGVLIFTFDNQKTHSDRFYLGPIISQLDKLNFDPVSSTSLMPFSFTLVGPNVNPATIPALNGVFPRTDDIAIQGRDNTDIILRKDEILLRAGKFVSSAKNENNPYPFEFNTTTPGYIQIKNNVSFTPSVVNNPDVGSAINIVANKINLLTHKDGAPRFNLANQENQLSDSEMLNILANAHPLPFGDILVQYLKLFKTAFLNHVHNNNGKTPTGLGDGAVKKFSDDATDLENRMLSRNIRIN